MRSVEEVIGQAMALGQAGHVREAAHMLRERLVRDPRDIAIRQALAAVYRAGGHPEQAARYVFAFEPYDAKGAEPYLQWLASTGADEPRIRHFSALPEDVPIPQPALDRLQQLRAAPTAHQPWETLAFTGVIAAVSLALVTLVTVYVVVLLGGELGRFLAVSGGAATTAAITVGTFGIAGSSWRGGAPRAAAVAASVAVVAGVLSVIAAVALFSGMAR